MIDDILNKGRNYDKGEQEETELVGNDDIKKMLEKALEKALYWSAYLGDKELVKKIIDMNVSPFARHWKKE